VASEAAAGEWFQGCATVADAIRKSRSFFGVGRACGILPGSDNAHDMSMAQGDGSYGNSMMDQLTPVVKALLILNLAIYFGDVLFFEKAIRQAGLFTISSAIFEKEIWEFITFQFIHGSVGHVLFNSIGLFFFGPWMERWWGSRRFLAFYLACGFGGAAFVALLAYTGILPSVGVNSELVGASAGIYGILIGVAMVAPSMRVSLLFPPVTLTMRQLALILMAISVGTIVFQLGDNEGGEAGHLGGAIVGFLLMRYAMSNGISFGGFGFSGGKKGKGPRRDIEPKLRPRTSVDLQGQSEIDEILDKISSEGFQSLTDEERDVLQRAAKNKQI
jgi:membrane associated rhomboid family serine protease